MKKTIITITTSDKIKRTFKPFSLKDTRDISRHLLLINDKIPGLNFADDESYASIISVLILMLSDKYCDKPLTKKEIENGERISAADLFELIRIAYRLCGIDYDQLQKEAEKFEKNILLGLTNSDALSIK